MALSKIGRGGRAVVALIGTGVGLFSLFMLGVDVIGGVIGNGISLASVIVAMAVEAYVTIHKVNLASSFRSKMASSLKTSAIFAGSIAFPAGALLAWSLAIEPEADSRLPLVVDVSLWEAPLLTLQLLMAGIALWAAVFVLLSLLGRTRSYEPISAAKENDVESRPTQDRT